MLDKVHKEALPPMNGGATKPMGGRVRPYHSKVVMFSRFADAAIIGFSIWLLNVIYGDDLSRHSTLLAGVSIGLFFFFAQVDDL